MIFTANQLVLHAIGDYLLQSDWMAKRKGQHSGAALIHATVYTLPFMLITLSMSALTVILISHFLIDRFRLARYLVWIKNCIGPNRPWSECQSTGYPPGTPIWLSTWLLILADNILHIVINGLAVMYL